MNYGIITTKLNQFKLDEENRQNLLCAVIAYSLPAPDYKADSLTQLYIQRHKAVVDKFLAELNEILLIDLPDMMVLVQRLYRYRVQAMYNPLSVLTTPVTLLELGEEPLGDVNELMTLVRQSLGTTEIPYPNDVITVTSPVE